MNADELGIGHLFSISVYLRSSAAIRILAFFSSF